MKRTILVETDKLGEQGDPCAGDVCRIEGRDGLWVPFGIVRDFRLPVRHRFLSFDGRNEVVTMTLGEARPMVEVDHGDPVAKRFWRDTVLPFAMRELNRFIEEGFSEPQT